MSDAAYQGFVDDYARARSPLASGWFRQRRDAAMETFRTAGFPTLRDEDWKYTDLRTLASRRFALAAPSGPAPAAELLAPHSLAGEGCPELVFVNGHFAPGLSHPGQEMDFVFRPLSALAGATDALLESHLGAHASPGKHAFIALNMAFMGDGVLVEIPDDITPGFPLSIVHLGAGGADNAACHVRNVIVLGRNAGARVIETYAGEPGSGHLTSAVTEIQLGRNATLEHYRLQREPGGASHVGNVTASLGEDSRLVSHAFSLGAALSRNEIDARLAARGASVTLNGLYMAGGRQHVDNHTRIDHQQADTQSEQQYRGVLDGNARAVFNGKVVVHVDAQRSDAAQSNANLLLSETAEVDTKPELEIHADDVKCSHGATVGQLDQDMLFYLRSRAIPESTARVLLTFAFAESVITPIGYDPVRLRLERGVVERLPDASVIREFLA